MIGVQESIYEQFKNISRTNFDYKEQQNIEDDLREFAFNMQHYPFLDVVQGDQIFQNFDEQLIQFHLSNMKPSKMLIVIQSDYDTIQRNQYMPRLKQFDEIRFSQLDFNTQEILQNAVSTFSKEQDNRRKLKQNQMSSDTTINSDTQIIINNYDDTTKLSFGLYSLKTSTKDKLIRTNPKQFPQIQIQLKNEFIPENLQMIQTCNSREDQIEISTNIPAKKSVQDNININELLNNHFKKLQNGQNASKLAEMQNQTGNKQNATTSDNIEQSLQKTESQPSIKEHSVVVQYNQTYQNVIHNNTKLTQASEHTEIKQNLNEIHPVVNAQKQISQKINQTSQEEVTKKNPVIQIPVGMVKSEVTNLWKTSNQQIHGQKTGPQNVPIETKKIQKKEQNQLNNPNPLKNVKDLWQNSKINVHGDQPKNLQQKSIESPSIQKQVIKDDSKEFTKQNEQVQNLFKSHLWDKKVDTPNVHGDQPKDQQQKSIELPSIQKEKDDSKEFTKQNEQVQNLFKSHLWDKKVDAPKQEQDNQSPDKPITQINQPKLQQNQQINQPDVQNQWKSQNVHGTESNKEDSQQNLKQNEQVQSIEEQPQTNINSPQKQMKQNDVKHLWKSQNQNMQGNEIKKDKHDSQQNLKQNDLIDKPQNQMNSPQYQINQHDVTNLWKSQNSNIHGTENAISNPSTIVSKQESIKPIISQQIQQNDHENPDQWKNSYDNKINGLIDKNDDQNLFEQKQVVTDESKNEIILNNDLDIIQSNFTANHNDWTIKAKQEMSNNRIPQTNIRYTFKNLKNSSNKNQSWTCEHCGCLKVFSLWSCCNKQNSSNCHSITWESQDQCSEFCGAAFYKLLSNVQNNTIVKKIFNQSKVNGNQEIESFSDRNLNKSLNISTAFRQYNVDNNNHNTIKDIIQFSPLQPAVSLNISIGVQNIDQELQDFHQKNNVEKINQNDIKRFQPKMPAVSLNSILGIKNSQISQQIIEEPIKLQDDEVKIDKLNQKTYSHNSILGVKKSQIFNRTNQKSLDLQFQNVEQRMDQQNVKRSNSLNIVNQLKQNNTKDSKKLNDINSSNYDQNISKSDLIKNSTIFLNKQLLDSNNVTKSEEQKSKQFYEQLSRNIQKLKLETSKIKPISFMETNFKLILQEKISQSTSQSSECVDQTIQQEQADDFPTLEINSTKFQLWHKLDRTFGVPKVVAYFLFAQQHIQSNDRNFTHGVVLAKIVDNYLKQQFFDAKVAGYSISCIYLPEGLEISIQGYHDKIVKLIILTFTYLQNFNIQQSMFKMAQDELITYSNITKMTLPLTKLGEIKLESLVKRFSFDPEIIYAHMKNTTLQEIIQFHNNHLKQFQLRGLIIGNILKSSLSIIDQSVVLIFNSTLINPSLISTKQIIDLRGKSLVYRKQNEFQNSKENLIINYYQSGYNYQNHIIHFQYHLILQIFEYLK